MSDAFVSAAIEKRRLERMQSPPIYPRAYLAKLKACRVPFRLRLRLLGTVLVQRA